MIPTIAFAMSPSHRRPEQPPPARRMPGGCGLRLASEALRSVGGRPNPLLGEIEQARKYEQEEHHPKPDLLKDRASGDALPVRTFWPALFHQEAGLGDRPLSEGPRWPAGARSLRASGAPAAVAPAADGRGTWRKRLSESSAARASTT